MIDPSLLPVLSCFARLGPIWSLVAQGLEAGVFVFRFEAALCVEAAREEPHHEQPLRVCLLFEGRSDFNLRHVRNTSFVVEALEISWPTTPQRTLPLSWEAVENKHCREF